MACCPSGNVSQVLCQLQLENKEVVPLIHFSFPFENPNCEWDGRGMEDKLIHHETVLFRIAQLNFSKMLLFQSFLKL